MSDTTPGPPNQAHSGPLADLRVVDMSTVLAGPNCARYLADFGADVIKVERPDGDSLRNMAWRDPRDGEGLWWKLVNRNKRTVVLDIKDADDIATLLSLLDEADVLVENSRPGTLERLGLGPEVLLARNPKLVITRISGFGQDGPYASRAGFATIAEAMSGLVALSGSPDGQPLPRRFTAPLPVQVHAPIAPTQASLQLISSTPLHRRSGNDFRAERA